MDEEIERLLIQIRADTQGFSRDVATMRGELEGPLVAGITTAARAIETGLLGALQRGSIGFEDLRRIALAVLNDIARAAISSGLGAIGLGSGGGGLLSAGTNILTAALGVPGRATGGPVSPGRAYRVGERGPELFVPTMAGKIEAGDTPARGRRDGINLTINVNGPRQSSSAETLQRSSRQVARAVRRAMDGR